MPELLGRRGIEIGFRFSFILVLRNISYDRSVKKHGLQLVGCIQSAARVLYLSPCFIFSAYCLVRVLYPVHSLQSAVCSLQSAVCSLLSMFYIDRQVNRHKRCLQDDVHSSTSKTWTVTHFTRTPRIALALGEQLPTGYSVECRKQKIGLLTECFTGDYTGLLFTYYLRVFFKNCFIKAI